MIPMDQGSRGILLSCGYGTRAKTEGSRLLLSDHRSQRSAKCSKLTNSNSPVAFYDQGSRLLPESFTTYLMELNQCDRIFWVTNKSVIGKQFRCPNLTRVIAIR